jgi:hypothetical protein
VGMICDNCYFYYSEKNYCDELDRVIFLHEPDCEWFIDKNTVGKLIDEFFEKEEEQDE